MATLQILVENEKQNKKFISHKGVRIEEFGERYVKGNGWECKIDENGALICVSEEVYDGVKHQITYKILRKGEMTLSLQLGNEPEILLKRTRIPQWPKDGILMLPAGFVDDRRPYFRYMEFQKLLDAYGLTAVCNQPANGIYELKKEIRKNKIASGEEIKTDGKIEVIHSEKKYAKEGEADYFTIISRVKVTGATWVIKKRFISGLANHKILYPDRNIKKLTGLPRN